MLFARGAALHFLVLDDERIDRHMAVFKRMPSSIEIGRIDHAGLPIEHMQIFMVELHVRLLPMLPIGIEHLLMEM